MKYTSENLISAIKSNVGIPSSQRRFNDTDFLRILNEELELTIVSKLIALQQDYFVETETTALVASTSSYDFPTRAIGWKVSTVGYLDSNSNYTKLPRVNRSQRGVYGSLGSSDRPSAFYVMGTKIYTVPDIGTSVSGSLQIDFVRIQSELVTAASCGLISVVTPIGVPVTDYQCTVNTVPSYSSGVDIVGGENPFLVRCRAASATVAGFDITVSASALDTVPVVGDYICQTKKTPIPMIPEDYHPCLAQAATVRIHGAMNDSAGMQAAGMILGNMFNSLQERSADRVDSSPIKIVPANHVLNLMR